MHMVKFSFDGKSCLEGFLGARIFGAFFGGISNWESQSGTFDQLTSLFGTGAARKLLTLSAQNASKDPISPKGTFLTYF